MASKVYANKRSILHKGDGLSHVAAPPDVCKTSTPGGPVPVPYVNVARTSDLSGTKKVQIHGHPAATKASQVTTSSGDEAGALGGILSNKNKGKMSWVTCSPDVSAEGEGVVRYLDVTQQNGNTFNTAFANQGTTGLAYGDEFPCMYEECKKPIAEHRVHEAKITRALMDKLIENLDELLNGTIELAGSNESELSIIRDVCEDLAKKEENRQLTRQQIDPVRSKLHSLIPVRKKNKPYMIGVALCKCFAVEGKKSKIYVGSSSAKNGTWTQRVREPGVDSVIEGLFGAYDGEGKESLDGAEKVTVITSKPEPGSARYRAFERKMAWSIASGEWECAAKHLIDHMQEEGHGVLYMTEAWYDPFETKSVEVRYLKKSESKIGSIRGSEHTTRGEMIRNLLRDRGKPCEGHFPLAWGLGKNLYHNLSVDYEEEGMAEYNLEDGSFAHNASVPSCEKCQVGLPSYLCENECS